MPYFPGRGLLFSYRNHSGRRNGELYYGHVDGRDMRSRFDAPQWQKSGREIELIAWAGSIFPYQLRQHSQLTFRLML